MGTKRTLDRRRKSSIAIQARCALPIGSMWSACSCCLMSGLQIFNAHPALYFGSKSTFDDPVMAMRPMKHGRARSWASPRSRGGISTPRSVRSRLCAGRRLRDQRLSLVGDAARLSRSRHGRRWHFFFAWLFVINGLVYLIYSFVSGHLTRDLAPKGSELKHIGASIWEHLRLRFPQGEEAKRYNVLQKLAYLFVVLVLLPLMLATGLAMSPGMDAGYPFLLDVFGGRQSARTIHFIAASGIVAVRGGASRHGADLRRLEQSSLHGHRALCDQASGGSVVSPKPKVDRRGFLARGLANCGRYTARRLRQRAFRAALGQAHSRLGRGRLPASPSER